MMRHPLPRTLLALVLLSTSLHGESPSVPFVINCGPPTDDGPWRERREEAATLHVLPDRPFEPEHGYGYERGEGFRHWNPGIWGRRGELDFFTSGRLDPGSYRIRLPAGKYVVAPGFCELGAHAPYRRMFDVVIQGRTAIECLDPFRVAGFGQAFQIPVVVEVENPDQGLTISFIRRRADRCGPGSALLPIVNSIRVEELPPEGETPPPLDFRGVGSYGLNALFWGHPREWTIQGYLIERREEGGEFTPCFDEPIPTARWIDREVTPDTRYEYRIRSFDTRGSTSPAAPSVALTPLDLDGSGLPLVSLELPKDGLAFLLADVHGDRTVEGWWLEGGEEFPVEVELRGQSSRNAAKKSYRVEFSRHRPEGRAELTYLKAQPFDPTLQQEKLTADVFRSLGLPVSRTIYVNVAINGQYQGVYTEVEPLREDFLRRVGLHPDGDLIRSGSFGQLGGDDLGKSFSGRDSLDALAELLRGINRMHRGELEEYVRAVTEWPRLRDYLAASVICHRSEIEADDNFYYRDPVTEKWQIIPWDLNNGNFGVGIGRPIQPVFGQSVQGIGREHDFWYVLPSRIFHEPTLRREYLERLEEWTRDLLIEGGIDTLIEENHRQLLEELPRDPFHRPPGRRAAFLESTAMLESFCRGHGERLRILIEEARSRPRPPVVINEFLFGEEEGWVELHNRTDRAISLGGYSLSADWRLHAPRHRFDEEDRLEPGALGVFRFPVRERRQVDPEELEHLERTDPEAAERMWLEWRREFPGFDPQGGIITLFGPPPDLGRETDRGEEGRAPRLDWYYYGAQTPGFSYGRAGGGFGFLRPSPRRPNGELPLRPAPLVSDGGIVWEPGSPGRVTARLIRVPAHAAVEAVQLHYRRRETEPWKSLPMEVKGVKGSGPSGSPAGMRAEAALPASLEPGPLEYYFGVRSPDGIERTGPLTAPRHTYGSPAPSAGRFRRD